MPNQPVELTASEEKELLFRARSRSIPASDVRRARLILMLAEGESYEAIQEELLCDATFIVRWKKRFLKDRIAGLYARHPGRAVEKRTPKLEAKILEWTRRPPTDGSTQWSTRKLAKHLGVHHMMVARVWKRARLQPHRIERYLMSNDPDFEQKAAEVIGLYVKPPQHAAVFSVDEKSSVQALGKKEALNNYLHREIAIYEEHVKKVPEDARARVLLANDYAMQGRFEEAKREADMAMILRPDDTMILYNAACTFCAMNNARDALIAIKKAWEAGFRDPSWTRQDPDLAMLHGDPEFERLYPAQDV